MGCLNIIQVTPNVGTLSVFNIFVVGQIQPVRKQYRNLTGSWTTELRTRALSTE